MGDSTDATLPGNFVGGSVPQRPPKRRILFIACIVLAALVAATVVYFIIHGRKVPDKAVVNQQQADSTSTEITDTPLVVPLPSPEVIEQAKSHYNVSATVVRYKDSSIIFVDDSSNNITLIENSNTAYFTGENYRRSSKKVLTVGENVKIDYNPSTKIINSIWE